MSYISELEKVEDKISKYVKEIEEVNESLKNEKDIFNKDDFNNALIVAEHSNNINITRPKEYYDKTLKNRPILQNFSNDSSKMMIKHGEALKDTLIELSRDLEKKARKIIDLSAEI